MDKNVLTYRITPAFRALFFISLTIGLIGWFPGSSYGQIQSDFFMGRLSESRYADSPTYACVNDTLYALNGTEWTAKGYLPSEGLSDLKVDQKGYIYAVGSNRIRISQDGGVSWQTITKPAGIVKMEVTENFIFGSSSYELFRKGINPSTNWKKVYSGQFEDFTIMADSLLYLSIYEYRIYKSADFGDTWEMLEVQFPSTAGELNAQGNRLYVGTYIWGGYSSDDFGLTWNEFQGVPYSRGISDITFANGKVFAFVNDQKCAVGLYVSDDGINFTPFDAGMSIWALQWLDGFSGTGNRIYLSAGTRGFSFTEDMGTTWTPTNNGHDNLKPHHVTRMSSDASGNLYALCTTLGVGPRASWGVLRSTDNGATWTEVCENLIDDYMTLEDMTVTPSGNIVVAAYNPGTVHVSKDHGETWQMKYSTGSTTCCLTHGGNDTLYAGSYHSGIARSIDGGDTWEWYSSGLPEYCGVGSITASNDTLIAQISDETGPNSGYYLKHGEEDWFLVWTPSLLGIQVSDGQFVAHNENLVYKSIDHGLNWDIFSSGLPYCTIYSLAVIDKDQGQFNNVVVATSEGLYISNLNNADFTKLSDLVIEHLYYDPLSEKLHFFNPEGTAHTTVEELEEELLSLPSTSCKPGLTISPNPVKGQAHLTLPEGPVRYAALTSTTGNSMPVNLKDHLLNVQGFQPGVYVLEVLVGDERVRGKVVVY